MLYIPRRGRKARWAAILCGLAIFFWLRPEDNHVWPVAVLSAVFALVTVTLLALGRLGGRSILARHVPGLGGLLGLLTGLLASISAALLMLFKNVQHAHIFPDYPAGLIGAMLERAPVWALAGGLIGFALGLFWLALASPARDTSHEDHTQSNGGL